jgi:DNA repair protein RadC
MAIYLNARNALISRETISIGSLNASLVHPREVFFPAVRNLAANIILAHNHPSGDVTPSREDVELTRRLVKAGELMGIEVLDHLVVAGRRFVSLKSKGLL